MKHEHKLQFTFVPGYYLIFLFWQNRYGIFSYLKTNEHILKVEPEILHVIEPQHT